MRNASSEALCVSIGREGKIRRTACAAGLSALTLLATPALAHAQGTSPAALAAAAPDFSQIAAYVFVMLGPAKILGPFAALTRGREDADRRKLALMGIVISLVGLAAAATIGVSMLEKWGVSPAALLLAMGIIIFLTALGPILRPLTPPPAPAEAAEETESPSLMARAFSPLAFPAIVPPQGVALVIIILAAYPGLTTQMLEAVLITMAMNLVVMLFAGGILRTPGVAPALLLFGNVLGVLQVALGVQMVIMSLRFLGALPAIN